MFKKNYMYIPYNILYLFNRICLRLRCARAVWSYTRQVYSMIILVVYINTICRSILIGVTRKKRKIRRVLICHNIILYLIYNIRLIVVAGGPREWVNEGCTGLSMYLKCTYNIMYYYPRTVVVSHLGIVRIKLLVYLEVTRAHSVFVNV